MKSTLKPILVALIILIAGAGFVSSEFFDNSVERKYTDDTDRSFVPYEIPDQGVDNVSGDINDWKTYRNEQYGFEFKYPPFVVNCFSCNIFWLNSPEFILKLADQSTILPESDKPFDGLFASVDTHINGKTLEGYISDVKRKLVAVSSNEEFRGGKIRIINEEKLIINGHEAIALQTSSYPSDKTIFIRKGSGNIIILHQLNATGNFVNIFDQVLSTFKFICRSGATNYPRCNTDLDISSDWKIYTDEYRGFSVKYPNNFYQGVSGSSPIYFRETKFKDSERTSPYIEIKNYTKGNLTNEEFIRNKSKRSEELIGKDLILESRTDGVLNGSPTYLLSFGYTGSAYLLRDNDVFEIYWWGGLYKSEVNKMISTVKFVTPSSADDTSSWETYRNEKYGFELKYPADFKGLSEKSETILGVLQTTISLRSGSDPRESFTIFVNPASIGFFEGADTYKPVQDVRIDGTMAKVTSGKYSDGQIGYVANFKKANLFVLHLSGYTPAVEDRFNQILSTFKFIP